MHTIRTTFSIVHLRQNVRVPLYKVASPPINTIILKNDSKKFTTLHAILFIGRLLRHRPNDEGLLSEQCKPEIM